MSWPRLAAPTTRCGLGVRPCPSTARVAKKRVFLRQLSIFRQRSAGALDCHREMHEHLCRGGMRSDWSSAPAVQFHWIQHEPRDTAENDPLAQQTAVSQRAPRFGGMHVAPPERSSEFQGGCPIIVDYRNRMRSRLTRVGEIQASAVPKSCKSSLDALQQCVYAQYRYFRSSFNYVGRKLRMSPFGAIVVE